MDQSKEAVSYPAEALIDSINPLTWRETGDRIRSQKPDYVIVEWWHSFFAPCIASTLSRVADTKTIFICHNVLPHEPKPFAKPLTLWALRNGDGFVVHAQDEEEILKDVLPNARVARTPLPAMDVFPKHGISRDDARLALGIDGPTVLFFGLIRKYKGLIDLIHAMAYLKDMKITCLVVGEFYDNKNSYLDEIARLGIRDSVRIVDEYVANEQVEQYFAAADVVALPYRSATQSGIVQVAYNFERPVIATKVGGLPEVVHDGRTGYLVPPQSPTSLADAIRKFFNESGESKFAAGVRDTAEMFSWNRTIETIENLGASL